MQRQRFKNSLRQNDNIHQAVRQCDGAMLARLLLAKTQVNTMFITFYTLSDVVTLYSKRGKGHMLFWSEKRSFVL